MSTSVLYRAACAAFASIMLAGGVQAAVVDITTAVGVGADATVSGFIGAGAIPDQRDTNYGSDPEAYYNFQATSGYGVPINNRIYLKFDLPDDIDTITSAGITVRTRAFANKWVAVWGLTDESLDNWAENTITWNNAPATTAYTVQNPDATKAVETDWFLDNDNTPPSNMGFANNTPLTNFLNTDTNGVVTLILAYTGVGAGSTTGVFDTKESGLGDALAPTLHLEYTQVPEPASVALLGLGGLAALRRRRA